MLGGHVYMFIMCDQHHQVSCKAHPFIRTYEGEDLHLQDAWRSQQQVIQMNVHWRERKLKYQYSLHWDTFWSSFLTCGQSFVLFFSCLFFSRTRVPLALFRFPVFSPIISCSLKHASTTQEKTEWYQVFQHTKTVALSVQAIHGEWLSSIINIHSDKAMHLSTRHAKSIIIFHWTRDKRDSESN